MDEATSAAASASAAAAASAARAAASQPKRHQQKHEKTRKQRPRSPRASPFGGGNGNDSGDESSLSDDPFANDTVGSDASTESEDELDGSTDRTNTSRSNSNERYHTFIILSFL